MRPPDSRSRSVSPDPSKAPAMRRRIAGWALAALAAGLVLAGEGARAERIVLESYQEDQGLTNLTSQCLVQDPRARLWICTANGLFRFDGFRIHAEPLPKEAGGYSYGARVDVSGRLWLLTEGGVFVRDDGRKDGQDGPAWTELLKPDGKHLHVTSGQQLELDRQGRVYAIDEDRLLWTATAAGALGSSLVVQRMAIPQLQSRPEQLLPMRQRGEALWFGCGSQLCEWRDGRVQHWGPAQGLPEDVWGQFLVSRDGSLWTRSSRRLARLAPGSARFAVVAAPARQWVYGDNGLAEDEHGLILVLTTRGLAAWNGERWREWTQDDGLPETPLRGLMFDAEGSLWLGTNARGVHRWIGYGRAEHWTGASGLPAPAVLDLARDGKGRLWAATANGVAWFDAAARRFRKVKLPTTRPSGLVHRLAVDQAGDLWWVDAGQVIRVKAGEDQGRVVAGDTGLQTISQGAGRVYASGSDGLELIELSEGRLRRHKIGAGRFDPRYDIRVLSDGVREDFVVSGRDLWRHQPEGWTPVADAQGDWIDALQAMVLDHTVWAGGTLGLGIHALSGTTARQLQFLPKSAFGGAAAASLHADLDGRLWMGTDQGVFIRSTGGDWSRLDRRTGLVWNDVTPAFLADADGSIWIGTGAGLTHLLPGNTQAPLPALRLEDMVFGSTSTRVPPLEPVPWRDRTLRIAVGTAGFSRARSLRIEYRLGAESPWRTSQSAVIDLGALESGEHTLEVRAGGLTSVEAPGPVMRLAFDVLPPWWNSREARAAAAVSLMLLWWLSIRWSRRRDRERQRQLEAAVAERTAALADSEAALLRLGEYNAHALEEERLRVSRELHDELGQQLAALKMEVSVAKMRQNAGGSAHSLDPDLLLGRVDRLVSTVRGLVSQLRPSALDGGLEAALQWLAAEFTSNTALPCSLQVDPDTREIPLPMATMVFRIAQESLTNVRRHAQASRASLRLAREGAGWLLSIGDDGIGFDPLARRDGFGVLGMQERARLLGGSLQVQSEPGAGTRVMLGFAAVPAVG